MITLTLNVLITTTMMSFSLMTNVCYLTSLMYRCLMSAMMYIPTMCNHLMAKVCFPNAFMRNCIPTVWMNHFRTTALTFLIPMLIGSTQGKYFLLLTGEGLDSRSKGRGVQFKEQVICRSVRQLHIPQLYGPSSHKVSELAYTRYLDPQHLFRRTSGTYRIFFKL